jgi:hypothetical protein
VSKVLFSQFADLPALEQEKKRILDLFGDVKKGILDLSKLGIKLDSAKGIGDINKSLQEYEALIQKIGVAQQKLETINQQLTNSQKQYNEETKKGGTGFVQTLEQNAAKLQDLKAELKSTQSALKELNATRGTAGGTEEFAMQLEQLSVAEASLQKQIRETSLTVRNQTTASAAASGSLEEMRAQLSLLTRDYDKLSQAERQSDTGISLQQKIKGQVDAIKEMEGATGRYQRNVGNYTEAVKVLEVALNEVKTKLDNLTKSGNGNDAEIGELTRQYALLQEMVGRQAQGFTTLSREVMMTGKQLEALAQQEMQGTEAFRALEQSYIGAKSQLKEFQNNQKLATAPNAGLQAMTLSAKALGGAYALGAGAAALFSDGNEKVEKELRKLMAVMTILQGLNEIHEFMEKRGAIATIARAAAEKLKNFVMTGSTKGIEENTVAMGANTAVMEGTTIATKATSAAMVGLRFALIATGIGALILLLPLFASAMKSAGEETEKSRKKVKDFAADQEEAIKQQKLLNDVTSKAADSYGSERAELDTLVSKLHDEHIPRKQKLELLQELKDKYPGYFDNINTEKDLVDKLPGAYERAAQGILLKAKAEAAQGLIGENYKKRLDAEIEYNNKTDELNRRYVTNMAAVNDVAGEKGRSMLRASIRTGYSTELDGIVEDYKGKVVEIDGANKFLAKSIVDSNDMILKLGGKVTDGDKKKEAKKPEDLTNDLIKQQEDLIKAKAELSKQDLEHDAKVQLAIADDEKKSLHERLQALNNYYLDKKEIEKQDQETELSEIKVRLDKIAQIESKPTDKRTTDEKKLLLEKQTLLTQELTIQKKHAYALEDLSKESADKITGIYKKAALDTKSSLENSIADTKNDRLNASLKQETEALDELNKKLREGKISLKEYEDAKDMITSTAHLQELQAEADAIDDQIFAYELLGADITDLEKKSFDIHKQIEEAKTKVTEDNAKKKLDIEKQLEDNKKKIAEKGFDFAVSLFDGGFEKRINQLQDEADANTKLKDAQIDRINKSSLSEQDKAAKLAQVNAQFQAKQDVLDKKKRDEQLKQAKFDRDAQVLKILGEAIAAHFKIMSQLGVAGLPIAISQDILAALEIGTLLAKPLPKYAKGTDSAPGGPSIVGEAGRELAIEPSGRVKLFSEPTLTNLIPKTRILPNQVTEDILRSTSISNYSVQKVEDPFGEATISELQGVKSELKELNKKSRIVIINQGAIESTAWYDRQMKH